MSFEDELAEQMRSSADRVVATPDLADVEVRAARAGRRRRTALTGGVVALGLVTVGSLAWLGPGGSDRGGRAVGDTVVGSESEPPDVADTLAPIAAETTVVREPDVAEPVVTIEPEAVGPDPADQYLVGTTEVYRRTLPDGDVFVARLSAEPYATVFGLEWRGPTGSAEKCLGDRALFIGVPERTGAWGSAWTAARWDHDVNLSRPAITASMVAANAVTYGTGDHHMLVRTGPDNVAMALVDDAGTEIDRADVEKGLALLVQPAGVAGPIHLQPVTQDGPQPLEPLQWVVLDDADPADPCGPGPHPVPELPEPGVQPADPAAAEHQIRAHHAVLVDRSLTADDKPDDLLDDDTGVADAVAQARSGQYTEAVASAEYVIDRVVFTAADTAWFEYTITATTGSFGPRFGQATFNGDVWQISRATICQDLALAGGWCLPEPLPVQLPNQAEYDRRFQEWAERAALYWGNDGCTPLSQC